MNISTGITILFTLIYMICAIMMVRNIRITTKDICIGGVVVAMTVVLEALCIPLPTGATFPLLSPIPLLLLALLWGPKLAIVAGWVCGVLVMLLLPTWQVVHWGQFFVEHLVCFSCLGFAGVWGYTPRWKALCGILVATVINVTGHTLSGVLFFSQNAWDGWGAWGYSLTYNLTQNVPLCILSGLVVLLMPLQTIHRAIKGGNA